MRYINSRLTYYKSTFYQHVKQRLLQHLPEDVTDSSESGQVPQASGNKILMNRLTTEKIDLQSTLSL